MFPMSERMKEAARSPIHSKAFRRAIKEFAKLPEEDARFEIRLLQLLFHE